MKNGKRITPQTPIREIFYRIRKLELLVDQLYAALQAEQATRVDYDAIQKDIKVKIQKEFLLTKGDTE